MTANSVWMACLIPDLCCTPRATGMNASPRGFHDPPEFVLKTKGKPCRFCFCATEVRVIPARTG